MPKLDLTKVVEEEKTFELLPEGNYTLTVENVEEKQSSKGNEFWSIEFSVAENGKKKIWDSLYFTDKTLNRVKKYFSCLGVDTSKVKTYLPIDIIGKSFTGAVFIEDYVAKDGTSKQKNSIDIWNSSELSNADKDAAELPF